MTNLAKDQPCPHCGRYGNRGVSVDAVIIRDGNVLLIKRGAEPYKDFWALLGGYVGWDEDLETAVRREVHEETGLEVTRAEQLGIYGHPGRHPEHVITIAFTITTEGQPLAGDDAQAYQWTNLNTLPELAFDHTQIINDYVATRS